MRVLIVDDHALFREGIGHILRVHHPNVEVRESSTCEAALVRGSSDEDVDLILLDLALPGMNGIQGIERLLDVWQDPPIVVVSSTQNEWDIAEALRRGVMGFIPKAYSGAEMMAAIETVLSGERYLPGGLARRLETLCEESEAPSKLTDRQIEVIDLMAQGLTNKGIANRLDIAGNTVRAHVAAVLRTLNASTRTEAVYAARIEGLIE